MMRFPRIHLATSVVNRIMDLADEVPTPAPQTEPPAMMDASEQGQALDQALAQPIQAAPAPVGSEAAVATEAMQGGTAADAVGSLAVLDAIP